MPETIAPPAPPTAKPVAAPKPPTPSPKPPEKAEKPIVPPLHEPEVHALQDDFDELSELDDKPKKERKPVEKPDEAEDKPKDETDKVKNGEKPKDAKPKEDEPKTNPELRKAYDSRGEKIKEYESKLKRLPELEAKVKDFESRDETATKATQDKMSSLEKRNAELEQHIRLKDYEKSKDYQDQFEKPQEEAWAIALRELDGLTFKVEDPKTGEEVIQKLTPNFISHLANLEPGARRSEINRLFPGDKEEVKRHVNQLAHLADMADKAKKKAKDDAETHAKTQTESQRQAQANRARLWKSTNEALATKYPKYFAKDEADPEGNAVFDKGSAFADLVFSPTDLTPERIELLPKMFKEAIEAQKPFTQDMVVKLQAIAAKKLANHDRAITKLKAAQARIEELEKSLKEYEESGPDKVPTGARRNGLVEVMSDEEELRALDRQ